MDRNGEKIIRKKEASGDFGSASIALVSAAEAVVGTNSERVRSQIYTHEYDISGHTERSATHRHADRVRRELWVLWIRDTHHKHILAEQNVEGKHYCRFLRFVCALPAVLSICSLPPLSLTLLALSSSSRRNLSSLGHVC